MKTIESTKSVPTLLAAILCASAACTWAATDAGAPAEANAGLGLARQGKYELAIPHYRAAIALDPHLPGIYLNLGLADVKPNKFPDAASALEEVVKADPSSFQDHVLPGMSYYGSRRFDSAAGQLKHAARQQPDSVELRYKLAQSCLWSGQYQEATGEFRFLLTRNPDSAPVYMLLGAVLDAANAVEQAAAEFEAAARHLREAIRIDPAKPDAHYRLGRLWRSLGREQEADSEFAKVKELAKEEAPPPLINVPGRRVEQVP